MVGNTHPTKEEAEQAAAGHADQKVLKMTETGQEGWVVIQIPPVVTGQDMRDATAVPSRGGSDSYQINFTLTSVGATKFEEFTGSHIQSRLAIILNDEVKSAPTIQSRISDRGEITGNFNKQTAEDLALVLRSGALPAGLVYLEERTVGPSLGADSIKAGVLSSLVGLAAIVTFMLFYYRGAGVNAIVALIINLIILMAGLVAFSAVLTLPGIAGVILTIGMAVDSNVLIFERIREELRSGKTVPSAVDTGFKRAFVAILDTHVTTIVSALFLFLFGTGPIRGFAVTLAVGLLANLFSSVYVSRTMFNYLLSGRESKVESLSI
jgi:preprotein translocase subunit SecD